MANYTIVSIILVVAGLIVLFIKNVLKIFAYVFIVAGIALLLFSLKIIPSPFQIPPALIVACTNDAECLKVQTTCCPCLSGGEEKCVSAKNASLYLPKNCPPQNESVCIALYNCKLEACNCNNGNCGEVLRSNASEGG